MNTLFHFSIKALNQVGIQEYIVRDSTRYSTRYCTRYINVQVEITKEEVRMIIWYNQTTWLQRAAVNIFQSITKYTLISLQLHYTFTMSRQNNFSFLMNERFETFLFIHELSELKLPNA